MDKTYNTILDTTIKTYDSKFKKYCTRTPLQINTELKEWIDSFIQLLPKAGKIFEVGSATGRDARYIMSKGYTVTCTDVTPRACMHLSREGFGGVFEYNFKNTPPPGYSNNFDGVFADAVLLHAPREIFPNVLCNILKFLKKDGIAAFTLKVGDTEEYVTDKLDAPRFFCYHTETSIYKTLEQLPISVEIVKLYSIDIWLYVIIRVRE